MPSTTVYKKGDIVLVPFPFTNLKTIKKRPGLIISPDEYNTKADVVIAFITSNLKVEPRIGDYLIKEWEQANLPKPSLLRMKFATIDKSIIVKKLGRLTPIDIDGFNEKLTLFLGA